MPQWHGDILKVELISANPVRVGSMISMSRRQLGGKVLVNADLTEVERNKVMEMSGMWGRFPFKRRIEFSPSGRETLIKDSLRLRTFLLFFWYTPFLTASIRRQLKAEWEALGHAE